MAKGEEALTQHQQSVYNTMKSVFDTHVDHIMICASAGGGSGGGSLKPLIMVAKRYLQFLGYVEDINHRVGVILTLPTVEEQASMHVASNALEAAAGISELAERDSVTPVIVIDNSRIRDLYRKIPYNIFWPTVNKGVLELFDIFNRLSTKADGFVSFDPADYAAVMRQGGHSVMGVVSIKPDDVSDEGKVFKVLDKSLGKTLLAEGFDYSTAKASGVVIVGGKQTFAEVPSMDRVIEYVGSMVANMTGGAKVYRGVYQDDRPGLRVYTVISGLTRPAARYKKLEALSRERYP
jgi:cell division GTPase FtsZ